MVYCTQCQKELTPTIQICPACGNRSFSAQPGSASSSATTRSQTSPQLGAQIARTGLTQRQRVLLIALGIVGIIGLAIVGLATYQANSELAAQRAVEQQQKEEKESELENEFHAAIMREMSDDIGKKVFKRTTRSFELGRYTGSELEGWDYQPIKNQYVMDLITNWEGKISGDTYWVSARAYIPIDYAESPESAANIKFEVREKSTSLITWERNVGIVAAGVGILEVLAR